MKTEHQATSHRMIRYQVDAADNITFVCQNWLRFADENASGLTQSTVIGKPLLPFISGADCRQIYAELLTQIRQHRSTATFPFRCDSPTLRRFMEMHISALPEAGHLQLQVKLLRQQPQPYQAILDSDAARDDRWIIMCSWCKKIKKQDQWIELSEAPRELGLFEETCPKLSHGICPRCSRVFKDAIRSATQ